MSNRFAVDIKHSRLLKGSGDGNYKEANHGIAV
jgi:hypothetical protein